MKSKTHLLISLLILASLVVPQLTLDTRASNIVLAPENYSLSGRVVDSQGIGVSGVTVQATPINTPLVLVHGFLGFSLMPYTDTCTIGSTLPYHYSGDPNPLKDTDYSSVNDGVGGNNRAYFDQAPQRFEELGYDVWIAHVASGPTNPDNPNQVVTPPLAQNGACLASQLEYIATQNPRPVTLVTHSMGGAVSRACLTISNQSPNCRMVNRLVTLGTPHAGLPSFYGRPVNPRAHPGLFELIGDRIITFNRNNPMRSQTRSAFLVGDSWILPPGNGDGVVGKYSGLGWTDRQGNTTPSGWDIGYCNPDYQSCNIPGRYWTNEGHGDYFKDRGSNPSRAIWCMDWHWQGTNGAPPPNCRVAAPSPQAPALENESELQNSAILTGILGIGESVTRTLQVDSAGASIFHVASTGSVTMTLVQPDGQVIDEDFALAHPDIVTMQILPGESLNYDQVAYGFADTLPGTWQINLINDSPAEVEYQTFAQFESTRTFAVTISQEPLTIGEMAILTATINSQGGGIPGAMVAVELSRADGVVDLLNLTDQGDGVYTGSYLVPDVPGYLPASILATGMDGSVAFERQEILVSAIAPQTVQLLGGFSDQGMDEDGNGVYESLDISMSVNSSTDGPVVLTGQLWAGDHYIATAQTYTSVMTGIQTLSLRFIGEDIYHARQDGPYILKNLSLTDVSYGSIPVFTLQEAHITAAYRYQDFGEQFVYLPLLLRETPGAFISQASKPGAIIPPELPAPARRDGLRAGRRIPDGLPPRPQRRLFLLFR
jgi:pimeloyl-ACP methyl ester carboxylesterase